MNCRIILLFCFFLIYSCYQNPKKINYESGFKNYSNKGFTLIYDEKLFKSKDLNRKMNDRSLLVFSNALKKVNEQSVIAIHDGVRPLIKTSVVNGCMQTALEKGTAIPVIAIEESLRQKTDSGSVVVNREEYLIVQTPQCFSSEVLLKAYQQDYSPTFTDDASVVEAMGIEIQLIQGNKENIKITTPEDLKKAQVYINLMSE